MLVGFVINILIEIKLALLGVLQKLSISDHILKPMARRNILRNFKLIMNGLVILFQFLTQKAWPVLLKYS